jgi:hypothetical protein
MGMASETPAKPDSDNDLVLDPADNCSLIFNTGQSNLDTDISGDLCDNCVLVKNEPQIDSGGDGFGDALTPARWWPTRPSWIPTQMASEMPVMSAPMILTTISMAMESEETRTTVLR